MEVSELRIGNWIFDDEGSTVKVIGFSPFEDSVRCDEDEGRMILFDIYKDGLVRRGWENELYNCRPIPLTEEWLERFGAVKRFESEWQYHLTVGGIKIYFRFNKEWYSAIEDIYLGNRIQHVHTLQNLVFALSGRELQMKNT